MRIINTTIIVAIGTLVFATQAHAQKSLSCNEMFKHANDLRAAGKYGKAISYYKRAMNCDANLGKDCIKWIAWCEEHISKGKDDEKQKKHLNISEQKVTIPWYGSDKQITVDANGKWDVESNDKWLKTASHGSKNFIIQCREANNSTRDKVSTLQVVSGSLYKSIEVTQSGRPEYIEAGATKLSFPAKGADDNVAIESNANWDVIEMPSWCKIEKKDDGIHIVVSPNDRVMERDGDIVVKSPSQSVTITIRQGAGEEHLALSQNDITIDENGGEHYIKVYTDAANWKMGDFPSWLNAERVGKDSIRIWAGKNVPNGESRSGSVKISTDRQTAGVMVTQSARFAGTVYDEFFKGIGGRRLSFGVSASYYMPFVSTSAGSKFVGSVLDYGLGDSREEASYKSAKGFSVGLFADYRVYRNIYLIAGVNYTHISYENTFRNPATWTYPYSEIEYCSGEFDNSYKEEYTHNMIEVPIMASYRFKVNDVSHVQLNLGPVLNFGLSAKAKVSGNTDTNTGVPFHSVYTGQQTGISIPIHYSTNADLDLYKADNGFTRVSTTGNDVRMNERLSAQECPLLKFNCGLRVGVAYEWVGISFGLYYTYMFTNMANKKYWDNDRWTLLNNSKTNMKGYKQRINTLEFKLAYTLRYLKSKK